VTGFDVFFIAFHSIHRKWDGLHSSTRVDVYLVVVIVSTAGGMTVSFTAAENFRNPRSR
jgi:hypothetical protein